MSDKDCHEPYKTFISVIPFFYLCFGLMAILITFYIFDMSKFLFLHEREDAYDFVLFRQINKNISKLGNLALFNTYCRL